MILYFLLFNTEKCWSSIHYLHARRDLWPVYVQRSPFLFTQTSKLIGNFIEYSLILLSNLWFRKLPRIFVDIRQENVLSWNLRGKYYFSDLMHLLFAVCKPCVQSCKSNFTQLLDDSVWNLKFSIRFTVAPTLSLVVWMSVRIQPSIGITSIILCMNLLKKKTWIYLTGLWKITNSLIVMILE